MQNVSINHNGFHGHTTVTIRVPDDAGPGDEVEVSRRVAKRINDAVCGVNGCRCGERIAVERWDPNSYTDRWYVWVPEADEDEIPGNYPQA